MCFTLDTISVFKGFQGGLSAAKMPIKVYRIIDKALVRNVAQKCWNDKWAHTRNVKITIKNYVPFLANHGTLIQSIQITNNHSRCHASLQLNGHAQVSRDRINLLVSYIRFIPLIKTLYQSFIFVTFGAFFCYKLSLLYTTTEFSRHSVGVLFAQKQD